VKSRTLRNDVREFGFAWQISYAHHPRFLATFEDLITRSDLIIRGRVVDEHTRLGPRDWTVLTDYTIEVLKVCKDAEGTLKVGQRLTVTKEGGNMLVEGKPVRVDTALFPPVPWITPHIFFIGHRKETAPHWQYYFAGVELGAWEIQEGKILSHAYGTSSHPLVSRFQGMDEKEFLSLLQEKIAALATGATGE